MDSPGLSDHRSNDRFHSVQLEYPLCHALEHQDGDDEQSPRFQEPKTVQELRRDVQELREEILAARLSLRELRTHVGRQRARIRKLEVKFRDELRSCRNNPGDLDIEMLDELHEDISQAWDVLGPEEEDCNEKEDDLNVLELRLEGLEAELYSESTVGSSECMAKPGSSRTVFPSRDLTTASNSEDGQPENDVNSPMYEYLSKLGDARIIRERLWELESKRSQYLDIQRDRAMVGHPQYQPNIDFLADYEKIHNEEFIQLQAVEMEVASLARKAGIEAPIPSGEQKHDCTRIEDTQSEIPSSVSQIETSNLASPQPSLTATVSSTLSAPSATHQHVNDWMFYILEISSLERARHKAIMGSPDMDDVEWANLVRRTWQRDRAMFDNEAWRD
ncbi:MAG: hypothetical protein HETSPECPRED_002671 [Heterodermia speciosa]|uniref:Uncharacterized protein n=1 Tax=Heterodermia speciosa TaxID=116794 RepID=A0A8H3J540_9LECA|nr:MAG: hypothetical protein HETSPECPRED_002671 [Heterodermia speciosa]